MPELDDDDVVGFEQRSDLGEAAFVCVAAGRAAADGFVDDGGVGVEEGSDVRAPAWRVLLIEIIGRVIGGVTMHHQCCHHWRRSWPWCCHQRDRL